jgi:hypothetical protein
MKRSALNCLNCRVKLWLFISYVVSFVSLAGSVGFLVQDALTDSGPSAWTGTAGVLQCVSVFSEVFVHSLLSLHHLYIPCILILSCIILFVYLAAG